VAEASFEALITTDQNLRYQQNRNPKSEKSHRTVRAESGLLIDFDRAGRPIGIEITAPSEVSLTLLNNTLRSLGLPLVKKADLAPLLAA
jgi:hypothetical protein